MTNVTIVDFLTLLTLVSAVIFGILEVRRADKARREKASFELFADVVIKPEHISALSTILNLPDDATANVVRGDPKVKLAADQLNHNFEFWGVIVYQRMVSLSAMDLLVGGVVRAGWKKLAPYIESERKATGNENLGEWFQWLAERLEEYPAPEKKLGAHIAFRSWKP